MNDIYNLNYKVQFIITKLFLNKNDNIHKNEVQDIRLSDEY